MQLVAPRAVRMAVATEAMICTTHLKVSLFVIRVLDFNRLNKGDHGDSSHDSPALLRLLGAALVGLASALVAA